MKYWSQKLENCKKVNTFGCILKDRLFWKLGSIMFVRMEFMNFNLI
jgi:hypothetical protein